MTSAFEPGFAFPAFTYALERVKCEEFARSIGDTLHRLPDGGEEVPVGSVFFVAAQDPSAIFEGLGLGWTDLLFGGIELEYARPLAAGETLSGLSTVAGYRERGEGERRLGILELRTDYRDEAQAPVLGETTTLIVRRGASLPGPGSSSLPAVAEPGFSCAVSRMSIAWMAVAITDPNPIHVEDEVARAAGFPSAIAHGTFPVGAIGAAVAARLGAGAVRRLSVRLTGPAYPGDTIVATASPATAPGLLDAQASAEGRLLARGQVEVAC